MTKDCDFAQIHGTERICGLLGSGETTSARSDGRIAALRELVEHFRIEWHLGSCLSAASEDQVVSEFTLAMRGSHGPGGHHPGQTCSRCNNLLLALRMVAEWVLPGEGSCSFCRAETSVEFVRGDRHQQQEACSRRTLRLITEEGSQCQAEDCHRWCMAKIRERLTLIGAMERGAEAES